MNRQQATSLYAIGDALAGSMEAFVARSYRWMWGISLLLSLVWFWMPTGAFASLQRPLLIGAFVILIAGSCAWVSGVILRCLFAPSAKK
jgi:hypothetical protein